MNEIIPVGILTNDVAASLQFYRKVLKIQRVQHSQNLAKQDFDMLKLESPDIEINSTETKIVDRPDHHYTSLTQHLRLYCKDIENVKTRLLSNQVTPAEHNGRLSFLDLNGIKWDLTTGQINQSTSDHL